MEERKKQKGKQIPKESFRRPKDIKSDFVREWLEGNSSLFSRTVYINIAYGVCFLEDFLSRVSPGKSKIEELTQEDVGKIMQLVVKEELSKSTWTYVKNGFAKVRDLLMARGYLKEGLTLKCKEEAMLRVPESNCVLSIQGIFRMREFPGDRLTENSKPLTLKAVTMFEMLLSTGMRSNELIHLKASDVKFGDRPQDRELSAPSPYVGASVKLDARITYVKNNLSRKMWLSNLATDLLKRYMKANGIPEGSPIQLFPFQKRIKAFSECESILRCAPVINPLEYSIHGINKEKTEEEQETIIESFGVDEQIEKMLDEKFAKSLRRAREQMEEDHKKYGFKRTIPTKESSVNSKRVRDSATLHSIRYTNICIMYYRTFEGDRNSLTGVAKTSGHSIAWANGNSLDRSSDVIMRYLISCNLMRSDSEWKALWNGRPNHWIQFRT